MKNFLKAGALAVALFTGMVNVAFAGGSQIGRITSLTIRESDGLVLVQLDGTATSKPSCALYSYWILKSETSLTGKQQLAFLLAAKLAG